MKEGVGGGERGVERDHGGGGWLIMIWLGGPGTKKYGKGECTFSNSIGSEFLVSLPPSPPVRNARLRGGVYSDENRIITTAAAAAQQQQ